MSDARTCEHVNSASQVGCMRCFMNLVARADRYEAEFSACKALLIAAEARVEEFIGAAKAAVPESEHPRDPTDWPWSIRLLGDDRRACYRQRDEAQRDLRDFKRDCDRMLEDAYQGGKRAEARAEEAERRAREWSETADKDTLRWDAELVRRVAAERQVSEARALALREAAEVAMKPWYPDWDGLAPAPVIAQRIRALAALPVEPRQDGTGGAEPGCADGSGKRSGTELASGAALPVEPARRQVTEITQEAGTVVPTPLTRGDAPHGGSNG